MIAKTSLNLARAAAFLAALMLPFAASAIEESTRILAKNQRAVESLTALGDQLKTLLTPDMGFPANNLESWRTAVDAAFAPELLEADFIAALDADLSDETREAALAYDRSALGQEVYALILAAEDSLEDETVLARAQAYLDTASPEQRSALDDLFAAQQGARVANEVMDAYFRTMKIAAEPVVGAEAADQWVAGAGSLRDGYAENYFLITVSTFSQLPEARLNEVVNALGTPQMRDYAETTTTALTTALNSATDRLATAYAQELARD